MTASQSALKAMIAPVVEAMGCELWGIEYLSQGRHATLRIYLEKEGGVQLDDCEKVSRQVSAVLDVEDPIAGEYTLEVSSPGMARPLYTLAQFARFVGEKVELRLRVPLDGRRKYAGQIVGVEGDEVVVRVDNEEILFTVDSIEKANIVPQF